MACTTHGGEFGRCGDRTAPVETSVGAKLGRVRPPSDRRPRRTASEGGRPGDRPPAGALRRTHHRQHGARNDGQGSGVRLEPAAVAAPPRVEAISQCEGSCRWRPRLRTAFSSGLRLRRMSIQAASTRVIRSSACCERNVSRTSGWPFVRPAPATATPCRLMSEGCRRSRATIASWAPPASSRRLNWRAHWPPMAATR